MLLILEQRLGFFPVFWAFTSTSCLHCLVISNFFATSSTNYARPLSLHFLQSRDLLVVCTKLIAAALSKPFWEASIIPPYTSSPFCFFELKSSPLAHLIDWLLTALPVQSDIVVPNLRINPYGTILDIRFPCQQSASYISKVYYAIHNHVALQVNIVILTYVALPWLVGCLFWRPWSIQYGILTHDICYKIWGGKKYSGLNSKRHMLPNVWYHFFIWWHVMTEAGQIYIHLAFVHTNTFS